jgi:phosphoglycerate dehydrogenase-like enzyme
VLGKASWGDPTGNSTAELAQLSAEADALVGTSIKGGRIDHSVMSASEHLRIVAKYTVGVDEIDTDAATELGIIVTHAPTEANWGGVVETTMMQMLTLLKKSRQKDAYLKAGGAWRTPDLTATHIGRREDGYEGLTVGIIGLGRIGGRLAQMLAPWRVRMIAYDPYQPIDRFIHANVERVDLDTLLKESDVVSLHVVLTSETHHMVSERELGLMKPSAILLNTSRGPVIDEVALVKALQQESIAGAGLDVFEVEPLPMDSPLRQMDDRVLLSPHMAANNYGAGIGPGIAWGNEDVLRALRGQVPEHVFNREVIPRWRERFEGHPAI